MTARSRTPTDEVRTEVFDRGGESFESAITDVTARPGAAPVEQATPTFLDPVPAAPAREHGEPIRVISMKDQADARRWNEEPRAPRQVQLRAMAEVFSQADTPPRGLGHLAPPRDARQARARRMRGNLGWAFVAIALAGAIMLAIWFAAGR